MTASEPTAARRTRLARGAIAGALAGAALAGCISPFATAPALDWNDAQIDWLSYREGRERAAQEGLPILLLVYTQGCEHGPAYSRLFGEPDVVAESTGFAMVRVDADLEAELDRRFMPDGPYVPRTLFLDPRGEPAYALRGADPSYPHFLDTRAPDELLMLMRAARRALTRDDAERSPQSVR